MDEKHELNQQETDLSNEQLTKEGSKPLVFQALDPLGRSVQLKKST